MNIKHELANLGKNLLEQVYIADARRTKNREFQDSRRVAIYDSVQLSQEQKAEIDRFYMENYGKKISYIWHQHNMAFSGKFDLSFFPEILYIPEFERYMNLHRSYGKVFEDKNLLAYLAKAAGIKAPRAYFSCTAGLIKDGEENILSRGALLERAADLGKAFIKPTTGTSSGESCCLVDLSGGIDRLTGMPLASLPPLVRGENWVIQECIQCHKSIADVYPDSVNTFRIITYRWRDEICHMPVAMRFGQGGVNVDNTHAGGLFLALEDDGEMHSTAYTEFLDRYTKHPDTGVIFAEHSVPLLPKAIAAAVKMHTLLPQIGVVNWDLTIDRQGEPVLIEANINGGSIDLPQLSHGKGAFGEKTGEVLRWMKFMGGIRQTERIHYAFGKMPGDEGESPAAGASNLC